MTRQTFARYVFLMLGWFCLTLGLLGLFVPLFPTTILVLVAVWAFSRSSPEMEERLRNNRFIGKTVQDWQDAGVIPPLGKLTAIVMFGAMLGYAHFFAHAPWWLESALGALALAAIAFVVTRPGKRPEPIDRPDR
ncbi:YbaN family protein [Aestuariivirga sp.]|uniref:YbaN family protein n=1 Tax=Aestuariivirga sp. TaxID=2650926 RepID=UPI0039E2AAA6